MIIVIGNLKEPYPCYGALDLSVLLKELGYETQVLLTKGLIDLSHLRADLIVGINTPPSYYSITQKYMIWLQDDCLWTKADTVYDNWMFGYTVDKYPNEFRCPMLVPEAFLDNENWKPEFDFVSIMNKGESVSQQLEFINAPHLEREFNSPIVGWGAFSEWCDSNPVISKFLSELPEMDRHLVKRYVLFHNVNEGLLRQQTVKWIDELGLSRRIEGLGWTTFAKRSQHITIYNTARVGLSVNGWLGEHHRDNEIQALGLPCVRRGLSYTEGRLGNRKKFKEQQRLWFADLIDSCIHNKKVTEMPPVSSWLGTPWTYNDKESLLKAFLAASERS